MTDEEHVGAILGWLRELVVAFLLPADRHLVSVVHREVQLVPEQEPEHKFVVSVPERYGGLLIGTKGATAEALRRLTRTHAQARCWAASVDVRVVKTGAP